VFELDVFKRLGRTTLQAFPYYTPSAKLLARCIRSFYLANDMCKDRGDVLV